MRDFGQALPAVKHHACTRRLDMRPDGGYFLPLFDAAVHGIIGKNRPFQLQFMRQFAGINEQRRHQSETLRQRLTTRSNAGVRAAGWSAGL